MCKIIQSALHRCSKCGYRVGLHHPLTGNCPDVKPIPNQGRMTGVYGYLETVFSESKEKEGAFHGASIDQL